MPTYVLRARPSPLPNSPSLPLLSASTVPAQVCSLFSKKTPLTPSSAGLNRFRLPTAYWTLTELHLQKNSLREIPPVVGQLVHLQVLDLSYNSIESISPCLGKLYQLRELNLSCNRLTDLPLEIFGRLCMLGSCKLDGNNIVPVQATQGGGYSVFRHACDNMSIPNPPERALHNLIGEQEQASMEAAGHIQVSVVCYNVLAELYATQERHPYCPTWALAWSYRKMRLLQELIYLDADIVCLQEVETAQYHEFFAPNLKQAGYEGVFKPKSRAKTMGNGGARVDGCAMFWKHAQFGLVEEHVIEFQNEAQTRQFVGEGYNRLVLRDNIALVALLELWSTRQRILIANTHIHWNPEFSDVKLIQTKMFLEKLMSLQRLYQQGPRHPPVPIIVSGDFNSTPDSGVVRLINDGRLDPKHADLRNHSYGDYSTTGMYHDLNLVNCYPTTLTPYTNCTHEFTGVLDYVFVTADTIRVAAVLAPVPMDDLPLPAFPNAFHPSDHVALFVKLLLQI